MKRHRSSPNDAYKGLVRLTEPGQGTRLIRAGHGPGGRDVVWPSTPGPARGNPLIDARRMPRLGRTRWVVALFALAGCGTDPVAVTEENSEGPRQLLTGVVIATDTIDIAPVSEAVLSDPYFLVPRQIEGTLPLDLGPTAGKLLVLSIHEVLDALPCPGSGYNEIAGYGFSSECATMVVLEQDGPALGRRPGRLTLSAPTAGTYYPWGNNTLVPEAEDT